MKFVSEEEKTRLVQMNAMNLESVSVRRYISVGDKWVTVEEYPLEIPPIRQLPVSSTPTLKGTVVK
jgi:hypothetical protein